MAPAPEANGHVPAASAIPPEANGKHAEPKPAAGPMDREALLAKLLDLVSERTGYPKEALSIDLDLEADLGIPRAASGDLTRWFDQGVLLLNRVLTVRPGAPASHRGKGWEQVTECAIDALAARGGPLVAILWGKDAQTLAPRLDGVAQIASPHPSPMAARYGFFGSKPFSRANAALAAQGAVPIDWRLE